MATLIENILNRQRLAAITASMPATVAATAQALPESPSPVAPVTPVASAQTPNKWGYDPATMEYLTANGYTPERLDQIAGFDPANASKYFEHQYAQSIPTPAAPDENRLKAARNTSAIADAIGLISQAISVGRGAQLPTRTYDQSASAATNKEAQRLADIYRQERDQYDQGLYNARLQDMLNGLKQNQADRQNLAGTVAAKRKADADAEELRLRILEQDRQFAERQRVNNASIAATQERNRLAAQKEAREARESSVSGSASGKGLELQFIANPSDPNAKKDSLGQSTVSIPVSQSQIDNYYMEAQNDPAFVSAFPQYSNVEETTEYTGGPVTRKRISHSAQQMRNIAAAYAKWKYYDPQWTGGRGLGTTRAELPLYRPSYLDQGAPDEFEQYVE